MAVILWRQPAGAELVARHRCGSITVNKYLRATVNSHAPQLLSWTQVPFTS
jgi:hypothetical protein